jgi:uncharacterized membrane protein YbaN (DUF454 family)
MPPADGISFIRDHDSRNDEAPPPVQAGGLRIMWLALGFLCVGLGVIGAMLPVMPTTIFLILAASCFARSSPRLEAWLLDHPRFGPSLRAWRAEGAIPARAKIAACTGIAIGYGLFYWSARPTVWPAIGVATAMAACALYILTRPLPGGASGL